MWSFVFFVIIFKLRLVLLKTHVLFQLYMEVMYVLFRILNTYYKPRKTEGLVKQSPAEKREDLYKLSYYNLSFSYYNLPNFFDTNLI